MSNSDGWITIFTDKLVSVLSVLKNPMILMGIVSMGLFFGMPYLMDNRTCCAVPLSQ